jgi:hypothetical protein
MEPMYGLPEVERDAYLKSEDDYFVKRELLRFDGNKRTASRHYSTKGNEYSATAKSTMPWSSSTVGGYWYCLLYSGGAVGVIE